MLAKRRYEEECEDECQMARTQHVSWLESVMNITHTHRMPYAYAKASQNVLEYLFIKPRAHA